MTLKQLVLITWSIVLPGILVSCGTPDKSKILKSYSYQSDSLKVGGEMAKKIGSWAREGVTCYGIIILTDKEGLPKKVKEIEAKIVSVQSDKIKMKALEDVVLAPVAGCDKIGMKKGETWEETDGDLFQTRDEAIKFIDTKYPETQLLIK